MKNIVLASIVAVSTLSFAPISQANDVAASLCEYVAADDKKRMRSFLKSNKLKIRNVFSGVQCNGQNLLEFASANNAVKTGELIIKKLPKNTLTELMPAIQSSELTTIAQDRISS